jgi:hypothetical protein
MLSVDVTLDTMVAPLQRRTDSLLFSKSDAVHEYYSHL